MHLFFIFCLDVGLTFLVTLVESGYRDYTLKLKVRFRLTPKQRFLHVLMHRQVHLSE